MSLAGKESSGTGDCEATTEERRIPSLTLERKSKQQLHLSLTHTASNRSPECKLSLSVSERDKWATGVRVLIRKNRYNCCCQNRRRKGGIQVVKSSVRETRVEKVERRINTKRERHATWKVKQGIRESGVAVARPPSGASIPQLVSLLDHSLTH